MDQSLAELGEISKAMLMPKVPWGAAAKNRKAYAAAGVAAPRQETVREFMGVNPASRLADKNNPLTGMGRRRAAKKEGRMLSQAYQARREPLAYGGNPSGRRPMGPPGR